MAVIRGISGNAALRRTYKRAVASVMKRKASGEMRQPESGRVARVQPEKYEEQLAAKVERVEALFAEISDLPEMEIFRSPVSHYRLRCDFRVFHDGDVSYYVMFESQNGEPPQMTRKDTFPAASVLVNELMAALMSHIHHTPVLRHRLYTVAFHTTLSGQAMITMVYHKRLAENWTAAGETLSTKLAQECPSCRAESVRIIGRSRKQKIVVGQDYVTERLTVRGQSYTYQQVEGCFTQPNGAVCQEMLSWAQDVSTPRGAPCQDLLELYCGNCNFTVPLAQNFRRVVATEVSRTAVQAGLHNLAANHVGNVLLVVGPRGEDWTETTLDT